MADAMDGVTTTSVCAVARWILARSERLSRENPIHPTDLSWALTSW